MRSSFVVRLVALLILAVMLFPLAMAAGLVPGPEFLGMGPLAVRDVGAGVMCAAFGGVWLRPVLMEQAEDPAGGGKGGEGGGGQAQEPDKKMTIGARLAAAGAIITKGDQAVADLRATI